MTLPDKPIILNPKLIRLSHDEMALFTPDIFRELAATPDGAFEYFLRLRRFMIAHVTNWLPSEIGGIDVSDLESIVPKLIRALIMRGIVPWSRQHRAKKQKKRRQ